ncbi:MAG TPA: M36 family metallopeptidase [Pyrinomonadaceae bacterium]|nr:M36 family metallopeptidase [Pyrinomonadaceae bacterium]
MPKEIDTRDFTFSRVPDNFAAVAESVSNDLPGDHRVIADRVNRFTGSTDNLRSVNAPVQFEAATGAPMSDAALIGRALEHVKSVAPALGFAPTEQPEFVPDPHVKTTSAGTRVVNLQQQYRGIPIFHMERSVWFEKTGEITNVVGSNVELPPDLETQPVVPLEEAVKVAAEYVASPSDRVDSWTGEKVPEVEIDIEGYQPRIIGRTSTPAQSCVVSKGPFAEDIPAHLVFFYQGPTTRLGWHMVITTPNFEEQYVVIVEADSPSSPEASPQILYGQKTSSEMASTRGNVWTHNPGVNPARELVDFPMSLADYPIAPGSLNLPDAEFPRPWINNGNQAVGNCTIAVRGNTSNSVDGTLSGGILSFDFAEAQGNDQKVVNIFYFCNYMHDFFYMLGFDEQHGNFQKINFTGLGTGGDPVLARAHPGPVTGTANMLTRADGVGALMNMGLVSGANRHTAFDSDVVFHEFVHGVSNRLAGGRLDARALQDPQSRGMGEGWSDYFALTIQNCRALIKDPAAPEKTVSGDWVLNRPVGVRSAPYDDNYPNTFGILGTPPFTGEHRVGEIWCAALMKMNRDFGTVLGDRVRGHRLGWQIVIDGLKLTPVNPSMLDGRDAILKALEDHHNAGSLSDDEFQATKRAVWLAFAKFGMGPNASSIGASLEGIVEDLNPPDGM